MSQNINFDLTGTFSPIQRNHLHLGGSNRFGTKYEVNSFFLERNGQPWLPIMGEFQYSRYPCEEWEAELLKIKAGGVQIVATYSFWIHHEEEEGVFDWTGRRNLRAFIELCRKHGFVVALRLGPFCHGEVRNGGLPDWLYGRPFPVRSNDPRYLVYVKRLYNEIGRQVRGLMFADGGPIVVLQCENEFMDSAAPWETTQLPAMDFTLKGSGGAEHMKILKQLAKEAGMEVPLLTATGWGSSPILEEEFLPLFGGYAYHAWADGSKPQDPTGLFLFRDAQSGAHRAFDRSRVPYACCEMGGGMQSFYGNRPLVPPASVEAMQVVSLGAGTNLIGYYVYHGGSNPVGKTFLNEHRCPRISYDFFAPIGEFGQLRESYHRLRRQFLFLETWGSPLAPMRTVLPHERPQNPTDASVVRCGIRIQEGRGFIFLNNFQDHFDLPPQGPFTLDLKLAGHALHLPATGALHLPSDVCGIFPFHLDLDGAELLHATAQPITRIEYDDLVHYFFFALPGIEPEYVFDGATVMKMDVSEGRHGETPQTLMATMTPGLEGLIRLETKSGKTVLITTLTNDQSLGFWKCNLWGAERVIVSDRDLVPDANGLEIVSHGETTATLFICPAPATILKTPQDAVPGVKTGCFTKYEIGLTPRKVSCEIEKLDAKSSVVRIPGDALEGLDELLLSVDYLGDIGMAHLNGKLINDNFYSGATWDIGLRRFLKRGEDAEVVISILPKREGQGGPKLVASDMASIGTLETTQAVAEIRSIRVVPRQTFRLVQD